MFYNKLLESSRDFSSLSQWETVAYIDSFKLWIWLSRRGLFKFQLSSRSYKLDFASFFNSSSSYMATSVCYWASEDISADAE